MKSEPLIIACSPLELALLGPDGRLSRRRLAADETPAAALKELWTAEYPEDGTGIVLTTDADPAALRSLCTAARQAGGRIVGAWPWQGNALPAFNDADLIAHLSAAAAASQEAPSLLARRAWKVPAVALTRRRRWATVATGVLVLFGAAFWHLESNARLAQRSAAAEAAHEFEEAQAAAGLQRRQTEQQGERELAELAPPCAALHEALLAVANAAGPSIVVDQVSSQDLVMRVSYRRVTAAPGADDAIHFPSLVREALLSQGLDNRFESEAPLSSGAPPSVPEPAGPTFGLRLTARPRPATLDVAAVLSRLPTKGDLIALRRHWAEAWTLEDSSDTPRCERAFARRVRFSIRRRDRSAWPELLALTAAVERQPGATIDQFIAAADGSETGAFARVSLTATFLLRGS